MSPSHSESFPDQVEELVNRIRPILAGQRPDIQSAVLADLLAMWLAGFHDLEGHTQGVRLELLEGHIELVKRLIEPNEHIFSERNGGLPHQSPSEDGE
jgi:hypothetical protein